MTTVQPMLIDPADAIHLNIGGQRFTTCRAVLRKGAPDFFDSITSVEHGTHQHASPDACNQPVEVLIDRDPRQFHAVLNFLRNGRCTLPDTIQGLLELRAEAEAYQVQQLVEVINTSSSMRVHRRLQNAAQSRELLQTAADALLAYAFGRDGDEALPGTMADAVAVVLRVELAATAPVQGGYSCHLAASIAGPAAVKELQHEYEAAGPIEPPLATSNLRSPFYSGLAPEQQAVWDEVRFLRKNGNAIAFQARQGSCFRVELQMLPQEPPPPADHKSTSKWRPMFDTTLRFVVRLV